MVEGKKLIPPHGVMSYKSTHIGGAIPSPSTKHETEIRDTQKLHGGETPRNKYIAGREAMREER